MYNNMDIMLDSWPYGGTATTTEALLMGVPLITMAGIKCTRWPKASHTEVLGRKYAEFLQQFDLFCARACEPVQLRARQAATPRTWARLFYISLALTTWLPLMMTSLCKVSPSCPPVRISAPSALNPPLHTQNAWDVHLHLFLYPCVCLHLKLPWAWPTTLSECSS
jgi:hypothetical protein